MPPKIKLIAQKKMRIVWNCFLNIFMLDFKNMFFSPSFRQNLQLCRIIDL